MRGKQKKKSKSLDFTFRFLSSPLFSVFLSPFFSLVWHLVGFILVGKVLRKAFRSFQERSLHSAQVSRQSCPWPLRLMTSQAVERTRICRGGYWWLRGEWVKDRIKFEKNYSEQGCQKFLSSRLILRSRWLWNLHLRHKFLRAEASRDVLKFIESQKLCFQEFLRGIFHCWCHVVLSEYMQHWEQCCWNVPGIPRHCTVWRIDPV